MTDSPAESPRSGSSPRSHRDVAVRLRLSATYVAASPDAQVVVSEANRNVEVSDAAKRTPQSKSREVPVISRTP